MATKIIRLLTHVLLVSAITGGLTACADLSYYLHSVNGHLSIINRSRDIEDVLADTTTNPELADRLKLVAKIRAFAVNELKLPESDSYTIYADLKRSYALKNLFAAPEFSIEPHRWCYPIVGCAGYRGYFDETRLNRYMKSLELKGFDVYVANVSAYSTLGWFDDPVLNTFIHWPQHRLAGMIFHELSHQQLYLDDDTAFNESFAVAVQQAGVMKWLQLNGSEGQANRYQQQLDNRHKVIQLISEGRDELKALYNQDLDDIDKRRSKEIIIRALKDSYHKLAGSFKVKEGFRAWFDGSINNAKLASVSTYHAQVPAFHRLLQAHDYNFRAFFNHVENIASLAKAERSACINDWGTGAANLSAQKLVGNDQNHYFTCTAGAITSANNTPL